MRIKEKQSLLYVLFPICINSPLAWLYAHPIVSEKQESFGWWLKLLDVLRCRTNPIKSIIGYRRWGRPIKRMSLEGHQRERNIPTVSAYLKKSGHHTQKIDFVYVVPLNYQSLALIQSRSGERILRVYPGKGEKKRKWKSGGGSTIGVHFSYGTRISSAPFFFFWTPIM